MKSKAVSACYVTVDGTDFRIEEPTPFDGKCYSHKFKAAGLRYGIGVTFNGGLLVWFRGPYLAGEFSHVRMFHDSMKNSLKEGEYIIADLGYTDERCIKPGDSSVPRELH